MIITHEFTMSLDHRGVSPVVDAVQGDSNTRVVAVKLTAGGADFMPPAEASVSVAFRKPDGKKGWYDKLPDGTSACSLDENTVKAVLAPEVLTAAGKVDTVIILQDENLNQLATFGFVVQVATNPAFGVAISNDYYNYTTLEDINEAVEAALAELATEKQAFLASAEDALFQVLDTAPPAIVCEATGEAIAVQDASDRLLRGLHLFGKTTQGGIPTPDAPIDFVHVGSGGSIEVTITDGTEENVQSLVVSTPNGLPGVPVSSGGNYTDSNGQQWVCDEIDLARGVYVQNVFQEVLTATHEWYLFGSYENSYGVATKYRPKIQTGFCTHYPKITWNELESGENGVFINSSGYQVVCANTAFTTLAEMKSFVTEQYNAGTPITVMYPLRESIETPIATEEITLFKALHSNKPNTTVYTDSNAGIGLEYVADTKTYIDNKFAELAAAIVANT